MDTQRTTAGVNLEKIVEIIFDLSIKWRWQGPAAFYEQCAKAIVEAIPELRPHQQEMMGDGTSRPIPALLP